MKTVAILGAGNVARTLADALARAGHHPVVGARNPGRSAAAWSDSAAKPTTLTSAAEAGDLVVNALPGPVAVDVLSGLARELAGTVLVDVANATIPDARGFAAELLYPGSSLAEELQRALPRTRVVKALNTVHVSAMAAPASLAIPPTAFLSGNDTTAKADTRTLLTTLGWDQHHVVDLGPITTARVPESFLLLVGPLINALGPIPFALSIAR
ncbi:NADPH-dependent F420 reductase [Yinghuangia soli]|uniref:NAD(P)-binding domain-containing protein n=1 Tax=Yinghuangia soli TaxID=2908204 RepID=A0AA41U3B9_9ACTN|nr:NAD(P)-binding domain-containing protein [Yinghuangia soli]MCF2531675.1 NAD(P)-binding domain-containing protein [Yinghuangia soli]